MVKSTSPRPAAPSRPGEVLPRRTRLCPWDRASTFSHPKTAVPPAKPPGPLTADQRRELWHAQLRLRNGRMQDHMPVVEQHKAIGHAVRAGYLYAAMADVVRFMDAPGYEPLDDVWSDVVGRKMYVTGGVGSGQYGDEGFGDPYLLPNAAYCESCAAIAHVLWQHRMNLLKAQAKYADVMELALYNGVLSGISISGDHFFYQNPLVSSGAGRSSWIGLSCCPTNLARIIPQVGGLAYARGEHDAYVNLYVAGKARVELGSGAAVGLVQQTDYPWDGHVRLIVTPDYARRHDDFTLCLRIPGWARGKPVPSDLYGFADSKLPAVTLKVNGRPVDAAPRDDGYVHLQRRSWQTGDTVDLDLPMPVHRVRAQEKVEADRGKTALMRGPIIDRLEAADQPGVDVLRLKLPPVAEFRAQRRPGLLGGVTVLEGRGATAAGKETPVTAIPYFAWANREKGAMTVWIDECNRAWHEGRRTVISGRGRDKPRI